MRTAMIFLAASTATLLLSLGTAQAQQTKKGKPCSNLQAQCAVKVGGSCDPQTNRWRYSEGQAMRFNDCIATGTRQQ